MLPAILDLVICASCQGQLSRLPRSLACSACGLSFPVLNGVPNLLLTPKQSAGEQTPGRAGRTLQALVAHPFVYDVVQRIAGTNVVYQRIRPLLERAEGAFVLDAGAGTGNLETLLPRSAHYLWLDPDPQKLAGFRRKSSSAAVLGDATSIPLKDGSVDWALSFGVSHHLDDEQLGRMLDELRRVTRKGLFFLDAVLVPTRKSRLLWRYDRGRHPRSADALRSQLAGRFSIASAEEFTVGHRYLLVTAM